MMPKSCSFRTFLSELMTLCDLTMPDLTIPMLIIGLRPTNERPLLCNDVSHWLGASLESALNMIQDIEMGPVLES